jgi:syntaxin-binding protein 1
MSNMSINNHGGSAAPRPNPHQSVPSNQSNHEEPGKLHKEKKRRNFLGMKK